MVYYLLFMVFIIRRSTVFESWIKRNGNAERRRGRAWRGCIPLPSGGGVCMGRGPYPLPRKFFDFLSGNGAFWCILGACFNVSIRRVKQSRKVVLCANCQLVSYLTWRTYHPWYHTHKHIILYQSQQSASQTHVQLILLKIIVNNWSIQKKQRGRTTFPLYKKERERRSRAFPSDSNPVDELRLSIS